MILLHAPQPVDAKSRTIGSDSRCVAVYVRAPLCFNVSN
jgi:hypothetical protein